LPAFEKQSDLTTLEVARLGSALSACGFADVHGEGAFVFQRFGVLLTLLSSAERDLVLTLLEDFLNCGLFQVFPLVTQAIEQIPPPVVDAVDNVVFLPLAETKKNGKPKSSSTFLYMLEHHVAPFLELFSGKHIASYERMDSLAAEAPGRGPSLIIMVDDFVGSGESATKTIGRFRAKVAKPTDSVVVVAAVAQQQGINLIRAETVEVYAAVHRVKGISDSAKLADQAHALTIMDSLEERLGIHGDYRRGFRQCESLVKMIRTPNNTFPVFWHPRTSTGEEWPAPFRRH